MLLSLLYAVQRSQPPQPRRRNTNENFKTLIYNRVRVRSLCRHLTHRNHRTYERNNVKIVIQVLQMVITSNHAIECIKSA